MKVEHRTYRVPFRQPVRTAQGIWSVREGLVVRMEDERGRVGWGEAAPVPHFGMEPAKAEPGNAAWEHALGSARAELASAGSAGAGEDAALPVAALAPAGRAAAAVIRERAAAGFRTFKWKIGVGGWREELALLDEVCGELPGGAKLRLDANGALERRVAGRWLERCAERPVEFLEQPLAPADEDGLGGLAEDYPTPIALDESLVAEGDLERWLGRGWAGVFVLKPSLFADPAAAARRLEAAQAHVVFSSALETAVGARAALRVAFGWQGGRRALGFGVWPLFADGRFDGPAAAPFLRASDVERIDPVQVWNALN